MALRGGGLSRAQAAAIFRPALLSGEWDAPIPISTGTSAVVANTLYAAPYIPAETMTVDQLAIRISTGAAGLCKLGIYSTGAGKRPGTLLAEASTDIDTTSTGNPPVGLISNPRLVVGTLYWLAAVFNATPSPLVYNHNTTQAGGFLAQVGAPNVATVLSGTPVSRHTVALTYGAPATPFLPASFGSGADGTGLPGSPLIAVRKL